MDTTAIVILRYRNSKHLIGMQFLNQEIENLTKRKQTKSLLSKGHSCGIFQDVEKWVGSTDNTVFKEKG